jgi:hypothetical protein
MILNGRPEPEEVWGLQALGFFQPGCASSAI